MNILITGCKGFVGKNLKSHLIQNSDYKIDEYNREDSIEVLKEKISACDVIFHLAGENRTEDLSLACKELNISNPLFVTDKDLINLDLIKNIILRLKKSFKNLTIFSNFTGNPIGQNVEEVLKFIMLQSVMV